MHGRPHGDTQAGTASQADPAQLSQGFPAPVTWGPGATLKPAPPPAQSQPLFELRCSNNVVHIHSCADSCALLANLLQYVMSAGDLHPPPQPPSPMEIAGQKVQVRPGHTSYRSSTRLLPCMALRAKVQGALGPPCLGDQALAYHPPAPLSSPRAPPHCRPAPRRRQRSSTSGT